MALQFISYPIKDLGSGTDQLSSETSIPDGFSESLLNFDPLPEGGLAKRRGYQLSSGFVPARVTKLTYTDDSTENICFTLDRSVDFSQVRSSPLVVYGRVQDTQSGDWSDTDSAHYYSTFVPRLKKIFEATGVSTTIVVPATEHGQSTAPFLVGISHSTSSTNTDNTYLFPDEISTDATTLDLSISYTNSSGSSMNIYSYYLGQDVLPGEVYKHPTHITTSTIETITIPQATHQLASNTIQAHVFEYTGSAYRAVNPDAIRLLTSGQIEVDVTATIGTQLVILLSTAPLENVATGSVGAGATATIQLDLTGSFIFPTCYLEQTPGGTKEQCIPDSVSIDSTTNIATISFTNSSATAANFVLYWQYGAITSNTLCVTGAVITTPQEYTDERPQLTIWGLDQEELYSDNVRGGWVTHLDVYRSAGETRPVCGMGGNLFAQYSYSERGEDYLLPKLYPALRGRASSTVVIGPAFYETTDTPSRTRGYIKGTGGGSNQFTASSISYDSGNGWVKYLISIPSMAITGTLGTIISTTAGLEDRLTVEQSGWSIHSGTFTIKQVSQPSATTLAIWVENSGVDTTDWDESSGGALCGIFSEQIVFTTNPCPFMPGDTLQSEIFTSEEVVNVLDASGATVVVSGITAEYEIPVGLRFVGTRTSRVIPLRDVSEVATVTNVVRGDMLEVTDLARQLQVVYINPNSNTTVTLAGDGTTATVTLGSGTTQAYNVGQRITLLQSGEYTGEHIITDIPSGTTLEFAHTSTASDSGVLLGKTIEVDENYAWEDDANSQLDYTVATRWIPIEAPDDSWDITQNTHIYHMDSNAYDNQPYLRSVEVADNLYLNNGDDDCHKFDGTSIYHAGLPRWQPHLFVQTNTTATGQIDIDVPNTASTPTINEFKFPIAIGNQGLFRVGDELTHTANPGTTYTVTDITDDGTNAYIAVDKQILVGAAGTLAGQVAAKYYFRLNAIDANQNIVASAIVGAEDCVVKLSSNAQVRLRLVGMPAWSTYDYDRLEVEIYRTQFARLYDAATLSIFYRVATLPLSFSSTTGYLDYYDTDSNEDLRDADPTAALTGAELGTQFSPPLRAKYTTSANNGLVLANLKDYPKLDVRLVQTTGPILSSTLSGKRMLLRKSNTDTGTTTNMTSRVAAEWVTSSAAITGIAVTSTTFTVTAANSLVAGDWVYLFRNTAYGTGANLRFAGWWQVTSATGASFVVTNTNADTSAWSGTNDTDRWAVATLPKDLPVYLGADYNYGMHNGNRDTSLSYEFLALRRLANAINTSMRKTTTVDFVPWVNASAGNEYDFGQLVLDQPLVSATSLELKLPLFTEFNVFVNNVQRASESEVSAFTALFPSRVIKSYTNFPEIFGAPTATLDSESDSAVDVNPADGQDITGVIPFFGESAFGSAQKGSIVVVFKTNSVYLVDFSAKASGQNPVQKIESQGLGCTAPYTISSTRDGIFFANESGIYKLNRSLQVVYAGRRMQRIWREQTDRTQLALLAGHHYGNGNQYKISIVPTGESSPSRALVYNHTREYVADGYREGSWTTYDAHPAIGWANNDTDALMATTRGRVYSLRQTLLDSDYRDDSSAIAASATLRAMDFGDNSIRKVIQDLIIHYRTVGDSSSTVVSSSADLNNQFDALDQSSIKAIAAVSNGLSAVPNRKVIGIRYSLYRRRVQYIQILIENSALDEPLEIATISFRVAGLNSAGIKEASVD